MPRKDYPKIVMETALEMWSQRRKEPQPPPPTLDIPQEIDVKSIRAKTGMSQREFAAAFCINSRSLQDWEQGRRKPESAVRAYLMVIDRDPVTVRQALMRDK